MKSRRMWIAASAVFLAWGTFVVDAQLTIVTNIAWAKRETTNLYFADDIGVDYTVVGRVISPNFDTNRTEMYIQDTNDNVGIQVLIDFLPGTDLQIGVMASARGVIGQTNGMRSIKPTLSSRLSVVNPTVVAVNPRYSQVSNFLVQGEAYESSFVVVSNATFAFTNWPAWGGASASNRITDGTGEMGLYINGDTDINGQLIPTNAFAAKGILTQFDRSTNTPNGGYQVMPRYYADIVQSTTEQPPQIYIRGSNSLLNVGVDTEFARDLLGQDRNGGDTLTLSLKSGPTGAAVADYGNRAGRFTWTPDSSFIGTTNAVTFEVTDGTLTNTATIRITVRTLSGGPGFAWINEFHYENVNEGVELAGAAGIDLGSYYILLYNGNGGVLYNPSNACSGIIDDEGNGYGAVWFPIAGMQNGPDGIALCHKTNGLLQFLSYGGSFIATAGPAAGLSAVDVGVSESSTDLIGLSLQLQGDGTNYEAFTWSGPMDATPGDINGAGQTINGAVNAKIVYSGLSLSPAAPTTNMAFDVVSTITPNYSANTLVPTAWVRLSGGTWSNRSMTDLGGNSYKTASQIPPQTNGTLVEYYVITTFGGPGTNSPTVSATNSYLILNFPPAFAALSNQTVTVSNSLTFAVSATDAELEPITLSVSNAPAGSTFSSTNGNGDFYWTSAAPVGVYTTTFYAVDASGFSSTSITIRVNALVMPTIVYYDFDLGTAVFTPFAAFVSTQLAATAVQSSDGASTDVQGNPTSGRAISDNAWTNQPKYWTFSITVSNGYQMSVTALIFDDQRSNTGPSNWFVRCSADNYASDLGSGPTRSGAFGTNQVFLSLAGITNTVTFHIHGTNNLSSAGTWRLDNVRLQGAVTQIAAGDVDGIPVSWWDRYNIPSGQRLATNNPDNDPDSNYEEFIADTDPTNALSYFVYEVTNMTGRGTMQLLVGPPTTNSRIYDAFFNTNLITGPWTPYNFNVPGAANGASFFLTVTNDAAGRFYRTGVKVP